MKKNISNSATRAASGKLKTSLRRSKKSSAKQLGAQPGRKSSKTASAKLSKFTDPALSSSMDDDGNVYYMGALQAARARTYQFVFDRYRTICLGDRAFDRITW